MNMSTNEVKVSRPIGKHDMAVKTTTESTSKRKRDSITGEHEPGRKTPRRNSSHITDAGSDGPPPDRQPQDYDPGFWKLNTPDSSQREITAAQAIQAEAILSDGHVPDSGSFRGANQTVDEEVADDDTEEPKQASSAPGPNLSQGDFLRPHPIGSNGAKDKKPAVGSEEWHRYRKDSHKEVERKRRETINDGINAISKLLPQKNEKNKGQILQNASEYIIGLKDEKNNMLDRWTSEKLIVDEALRTLTERNEHLQRLCEAWKECARNSGVDVEEYDTGVPPFQPSGSGVATDVARRQSEGRSRESVAGGADARRSSAYATHDASAVTMEDVTQVQKD